MAHITGLDIRMKTLDGRGKLSRAINYLLITHGYSTEADALELLQERSNILSDVWFYCFNMQEIENAQPVNTTCPHCCNPVTEHAL